MPAKPTFPNSPVPGNPPMGVPSGQQPTYPQPPIVTGPSGSPTYPQPPMGGPSGPQPPYPMQGNMPNRIPGGFNPTIPQQGVNPSNPYAPPMSLNPGQSPYPTGPSPQNLPLPPKKSNKSFWFFAAIFIVVLLAGSCSMCVILFNNSSSSSNSSSNSSASTSSRTSSDTSTTSDSQQDSTAANEAEAHFDKAADYVDEGNLPLAIAEFQQAIALNPNYFEAQQELAVSLYNNKQYSDAAPVFLKAYELAQTNPQMLAFAGYAYQLAGQTQQATETYDQFLQKHSNSSLASKIQEIKDGKISPPTEISLEE
jgi:predicted negative regulator of RcsB-dependent stress response